MKIAIGCDHGGFEHKNAIVAHLKEQGHEVLDCGIYELATVDYPDIAKKVCSEIISGNYERGILVCGTGVGMSISANKIKGIRAACLSDHFSAKYTRLHNDSNVLCMGGRVVEIGVAIELADIFINTEFEGGRHANRVAKIKEIEENN